MTTNRTIVGAPRRYREKWGSFWRRAAETQVSRPCRGPAQTIDDCCPGFPALWQEQANEAGLFEVMVGGEGCGQRAPSDPIGQPASLDPNQEEVIGDRVNLVDATWDPSPQAHRAGDTW
jgi:hypothetical protein